MKVALQERSIGSMETPMKGVIRNKYLLALPIVLVAVSVGLFADIGSYKKYAPQAKVESVTIYAKERAGSDKKIARKGQLVYYEDAIANIAVFHGFMCDKFDIAFLRRLFPRGRYNILTVDFRAHGEDAEGQCCTFGRDEAQEVIAAAKFLKQHPATKGKPVFTYALSMGAVAAIEAQAKEPNLFAAMILDSAFDSTEAIVKNGLSNLKFSLLGYTFDIPVKQLLQKYAFHPYVQTFVKSVLKAVSQLDTQNINAFMYPLYPAKSAQKITVPCFFIHCKHDEKVSVSAAKTIFAAAKGPKKIWLTNGRRHYDSFFYAPEKYTEQVRLFFDQVLSGKWNQYRKEIMEDLD